ncbi:MAG: V-type ATP synthase subunit E family protein [Halobacteriota archaeon]|nr:V-type ATP synthase subunit E family protein [Halobacteriota archaeon]
MGVNEITKKIKDDSDKIVADIKREANAKAEKIIEGAKSEAEKKKKSILTDGEKQAVLRKQRIIADAKLKSKKIEWDAKEELISEVMAKSRDGLINIKEAGHSGKSYSEILLKLIKEASINSGGGDLEVILSTGDMGYVSEGEVTNLAQEIGGEVGSECKISLSSVEYPGLGGPIVKAKSEHIEVNNTLEERIERFSDSLRTEITRILFGG